MNCISELIPHHDIHHRQIVVGFSGGADSTALLLLLQEQNFHPLAVHFHHGLRDESDQEEIACREFCLANGIELQIIHLQVTKKKESGESIEEACRRLRLQHWQDYYPANKYIIALAHHKDDRRENFILRFLRGSNCSGLTGLRPISHIGNIEIWRPLLNSSATELKDYLSKRHQNWCEDSSNQEVIFMRNRVRHHVIPALNTCAADLKGLDHCLDRLEQEARFLENLAAKYVQLELTTEQIRQADKILLPRIWTQWLRLQGDNGLLQHQSLLRLENALYEKAENDREIPIGRQRSIIFLSDGQIVIKKKLPPFQPIKWSWAQEPVIELTQFNCRLRATLSDSKTVENQISETFSVVDFPQEITIERYREGLRMLPFGRKTPQKLSKLFNQLKIPAYCRTDYPILYADSENALWLAPLKRAEFGRCHQSEKQWIVITYEKL